MQDVQNIELGKLLAEARRHELIRRTVKLDPRQAAGGDSRRNLIKLRIDEDPIRFQLRRQPGRDLPNPVRVHPPGARSKDEPDRIRSALSREQCILKVGVAADFDPHSAVSLGHGRGRKQILQRFFRVGLAHERFTDQEGVEPNRPQAVHVFSRLDAALAHVHGAGR